MSHPPLTVYDELYDDSHDEFEAGANTVHLSGWMVIEEAKVIPLNGKSGVSIRARLYLLHPNTHPHSPKNYPVLLAGKQAEILVESYRSGAGQLPKAVVDGSLFNVNNDIFVLCRRIEILNRVSTGPLPALRSAPAG